VQIFDHRSLWAVAAIEPSLRLAALTEGPADVQMLADRGASIWSPAYTAVDRASLQAAHAAGLAVIPWTVNDVATMRELIDLGVDGLITDRPDLLF
jgi:glycerophosphoryl diester phosphodiesterase